MRPRAVAVGRMLWSPTSRRGLARVIDDFRPDVLHLHNIYHQLSPSVLAAARAAGVPCVLTMHDYKLACPSYQLLDRGRPCQACVTGGPLQAARRRCKDGSLSRSAPARRRVLAAPAVRRVRPGAALRQPERVPGRRDAPRGRLPGPAAGGQPLRRPDRRRGKQTPGGGVVFAGRLSPEKGVDVLIEAAAALPDGVGVDVAGDGPARPELEALAARRAPGRVRFHGRLDKPRLHELIRSAAVVAVPSRWHENQPMAVLEAFACGVPVVATDLGGLPELVEPEVDGRHRRRRRCRPPSATRSNDLLADPQRAYRMGRAGRAKIAAAVRPGPAPGPDPWAVRGGRRGVAVAAAGRPGRRRWGSGPVSPVRVLYLAGSGRSGSTLVTTVLGQLPGFFAAGELRYLWRRGILENRPCGCGSPVADCPLWARVRADLTDADPGRDRRPVGPAAAAARTARTAAPPAAGAAAGRGPPRRRARWPGSTPRSPSTPWPAGRTASSSTPPSCRRTGPCSAACPASTCTSCTWCATRAPPRTPGVADAPLDGRADDQLMSRPPVGKAALLWLVWNTATVRLWGGRRRAPGRYLRVRYEDFVADPAGVTARIAGFVGATPDELPFPTPATVRLAPTHSVAGNPSRHRTGLVDVVADTRVADRAAHPRVRRGDRADRRGPDPVRLPVAPPGGHPAARLAWTRPSPSPATRQEG